MIIADDRRLVEMAAERASALFPVLDRARALTPLIVLLAILPGIYALQVRTETEADALWSLKALTVATVAGPGGFLDPPATGLPAEIAFHSPLATWLTAAAMKFWGSGRWFSSLIVSYLSVAALIGLTSAMWRRLVDARFAFWVSVLLAFHPTTLALVQDPSPIALSLALLTGTIFAFVDHVERREGMVSRSLLLAGILLGTCLLASGPMALFAVVVLLLYVMSMRHRIDKGGVPAKTFGPGWPAMASLLILVLTGFAVGGWWPAMMFSRHGWDFAWAWLGGADAPAGMSTAAAADRARSLLARFEFQHGTLSALFVIGAWRIGGDVLRSSEEPTGGRDRLLVAWLGCAVFQWSAAVNSQVDGEFAIATWRATMLIPCIVLSAWAIREISERRIRCEVVVGIVVLMWGYRFAPRAWLPFALGDEGAAAALLLIVVMVATISVGIAWWIGAALQGRDQSQRLLLTGIVAGLVVAHGIHGIESCRRERPDDGALRALDRQFDQQIAVDATIIVARDDAPRRLQHRLRTTWPTAGHRQARSWDSALQQILQEYGEVGTRIVVVDWGIRETRPSRLRIGHLEVERLPTSVYLDERQVRTFLVRPVDE